MNRMKICLLTCVTASLLAVLFVVSPAMVGANQQSVELIHFELRSISSGVEIRWETATESDIAYFKVKRGPAPDGPHEDLAEIGLIEAVGSPVSGSAYSAVDETAVEGQAYSYQLVELTLTNEENVVAEDDISLIPMATGEPIGGLPPSPTPSPTGSGQSSTATSQPTAAATSGNPTPRPTTSSGNATVAPTVAVTGTTAVATPTRPANTLGPTPTRFSFTPRPPAAATTGSPAGPPDVQAAAPPALAQTTIEPYPAPGGAGVPPTNTEQTAPGALPTTQVFTTAVGAPEQPQQAPAAYPGNALDTSAGLPNSVGAGVEGQTAEGTQMEEEAVQETSGTTRLLLWLGFLAAFFIFIGGIGFSIVLSTRRRENDLP